MIKIIKGLNPNKFTLDEIETLMGVFTIIVVDSFTQQNKEFINFLLEKQESVFLNIICSGYGGSAFEPHCPKPMETKNAIQKLLRSGFPVENIMLTISPVIRNSKGMKKAEEVLNLFSDSGIYKIHLSNLIQTKIQEKRMLNKFGTTIKEDFSLFKKEDLIRKFNDYKFFVCQFENEKCKVCVPENLSYQLMGCLATDINNKNCHSLTATSYVIKDLSKNLMYQR